MELFLQSVIENKSYQEILTESYINYHYFTVQALTDCEVLRLSIRNLGRMIAEFPEAFELIFANADKRITNLL